jgi:predicted nucleic acid-binding protein
VTPKPASRTVVHVAEPPAPYLGRPPIVLDCSVLSAVLFQEEARHDALRSIAGKTLHAPVLLSSEIVSVALKKRRGGWLQPYLWVAGFLQAPLATFDAKLAKAARAYLAGAA